MEERLQDVRRQEAELAELAADFLEAESPIPEYQIADFKPWVGKKFTAINVRGEEQGEFLLEKIDEYPENQTRRKSVRKFPFSLFFSRSDLNLIPTGYYKMTGEESDADPKILYLKPVDYCEQDEVNVYESIIN